METEIDVNIQDQIYGHTPLMLAARNGFDEVVLYLGSLYCAVELVQQLGGCSSLRLGE